MIIDLNTILECGCSASHFKCFRKVTYEELDNIISVNTETGEAVAEDAKHITVIDHELRMYPEKDIFIHCQHGIVK